MNMGPEDWSILVLLLAFLFWGAYRTKRYTGSVSAFLSARRCGGRYLIAVADEMSKLGVISLVWYFEVNYKVGFTSIWWGLMEGPTLIIMALSGWVVYRFRQTRALTLAQFFEMRYSRNFRVFAGVVAYLAGIINFGIFPAVGARFFINLCGLGDSFNFGGLAISTYPLLMMLLLAISLVFLFWGGQIAVMVTDFLQGILCNVVFIVLILFLLWTFRWDQISEVLLAAPLGKSMVHPFDLGQEQHFNFWYYLISVIIIFYCAKGWQGTQGYNCAATSAHEAKMAFILSGWRFRVLMLITLILPICVRTFLHHPDFAAESQSTQVALQNIDSAALQNQARTPLVLGTILPVGLLGLVCAAMLGAFISTHDTYLHSWGSILVQDIILPFTKKPLKPQEHLKYLRLSILGVAVFIFLFSLLFQQTQYISMFLAITGAIFVGGAGSAIIGGLYWKRGTTEAAWAAMITGMALSVAGIVIKQLNPDFFLTGQEMTFWAMASASTIYVLVSCFGPGRIFNMDRLLHRGEYAIQGDTSVSVKDASSWLEKLGFSKEFTGRDKIVTFITLSWPLAWTAIFVVVTIYNIMFKVSAETWLAFWHGWTWFILICSIIITVWFTIGGFGDLKIMFRRLSALQEDPLDDGRVTEHQ